MIIREEFTIDAWKKALKEILLNGVDFQDDDGRVCREEFSLKIEVLDTQDKVYKPIQKLRKFDKWYYPNLQELKQTILSKQAKTGFTYSYGQRFFSFKNQLNQIDNFIIPLLRKKPTSRRATAVIYDPLTDSKESNKEIPSFLSLSFLIRENKLNLFATIRSCEMFFGWPANIYQISVIQDYVAKILNVKPGIVSFAIISAHIFLDQEDEILEVID
jgi:thymidylate synthase (methanogen type)